MLCNNCGGQMSAGAQFCGVCGAYAPSTPPPPPHQSYAPPPTRPASSSFIARLHSYGSSTPFLLGCILWSVGSVIGLLMHFTILSILSLALMVLVVIGLWMMYAASVSPKRPEKALPALTMFKVTTVINLILYCIFLAVVVLLMVFMMAAGAIAGELFEEGGGLIMAAVFLVFALIITLMALWIRFYYVALLRTIKSIRYGIFYNKVREIRGVGSFVILSYIMVAFTVILNLLSLALQRMLSEMWNEIMDILIWEIPPEFRDFVIDFPLTFQVNVLPVLLSLVASVGLVLLLSTLRRFATSIELDPPG